MAGTKPGDYRPTPPKFPAPVFTNWGSVTPFLLRSGRQFRPAPPPPVTSAAYAKALNEVKSLGQDVSTTRTADQTAAAKFWASAPIWNTWNQVAQNLAVTRHASLEQTATVFANLDLALADATIGLYDAKYHYLVWRPVTAIQLGDTIGNPAIVGDPNWTPLAVTAADPSYPGAHSTISQAAATVLAAFYGHHQHLAITLSGVTRTFGSFQAAANEAGLSRIFAYTPGSTTRPASDLAIVRLPTSCSTTSPLAWPNLADRAHPPGRAGSRGRLPRRRPHEQTGLSARSAPLTTSPAV